MRHCKRHNVSQCKVAQHKFNCGSSRHACGRMPSDPGGGRSRSGILFPLEEQSGRGHIVKHLHDDVESCKQHAKRR